MQREIACDHVPRGDSALEWKQPLGIGVDIGNTYSGHVLSVSLRNPHQDGVWFVGRQSVCCP